MTEALRASNVPEIERYELGSLIGRGSMGAVYEAKDADGRVVALKILHAEAAAHEMALTRFEREVELARRIDHPAVPEIFDWGQLPDGRLFLAMERLHGDTLEGWWETPGRPRAHAMELLLEALGPLAAAHRLGIVHRDLKPENVFVLDRPDLRGRVRLLDFGIARDIDEDAKSKTATGVAVGTPVYMSPEQATKPRLASQPTDVWSFGVMMYEALCGELPFDGDTPHAVIIAVATEPHVPLAERAPELHPDLLALVERCLLKDPSRRPRDAAELEALLGGLLARPEVVRTIDGFAATPPFRLSSRPTSGDAAPIELRARGETTLDEGSATPSSSGLRRIDVPRRPWLPIAIVALLAAVGVGAWAWTRASSEAVVPASSAPSVATSSTSAEPFAVSPSERSGGPATEEPPAPADTPEPADDGEDRRDAFDDGPGPAPEVSVRRATSMARAREVAPSVDVQRVADVVEAPEEASVASAAPSATESPSVAPSADTPSVSAPTVTTPDTPSVPSVSTSTTEPSTPMTRTVRRVVRRPATNTPTRPGFVTF